jgi:hypothetical protein
MATLVNPSRHVPAEVFGDDDAEPVTGEASKRSRSPRAERSESYGSRQAVSAVDIGLVHPRIRAHQPVVGLHDEHNLVLSHHASALAQYHLDEAGIRGDLFRHCPWIPGMG